MAMSDTNKALDRFVKSEMKRLNVPGVGVGILKGKQRYAVGYGITSVENPLPVDGHTLFQIGSTTKTFTATAVMKLVEQGLVDLDTPIRRYLPELKLKDAEATRRVTLRHLLTHTGGWIGDFFNNTGWGDDALALNVAKLVGAKQLTKLGTVWHYSNSGFYLAGRVIEKVTKKPYEDAIKEMLFEPLGMTESFFFPAEVMLRRFAVGHMTQGKKNIVAPTYRASRGGAPAGAIVSSANDQLKWAAFHMGDGKAPNGKRVLKKSTLEYMRKPHFHVGSMTEDVGISWLLNTVGGLKVARHGGTTIGFLSAFAIVPERDFGVTVLTNSTSGRMLHASVVQWAFENYIGAKSEEGPAVKLDSNGIGEYIGQYQSQSTPEVVVDAVANSRNLVLRFPVSLDPPRSMPMPIRFYEQDKFVVTSGDYKGTHSDFVRSQSGRIQWLRFGGRLYRRMSPTAAKTLPKAGR